MIAHETTLASHLFQIERRRSNRNDVTITTQLQLRDRSLVPIEINNLSQGGCMARTPALIAEREAVKIDIPGLGWKPAIVCWAMNDSIGLSFHKPLDWQYFKAILRLYTHPD